MAHAQTTDAIGDRTYERENATNTIVDSLSQGSVNSLFQIACQEGQMALVRFVFSHVDPSVNCNAAIKSAADNGQFEIVRFLLKDERVNRNQSLQFALKFSCHAGDEEAVKQILAPVEEVWMIQHERFTNSLRLTDVGQSSLWVACCFGRTAIVRLLLADGRVFNHFSNNCMFPAIAAENGHCDIVHLLVEDSRVNQGMDFNFAFQYYCSSGDIERVKALLSDPKATPTNHAMRLVKTFPPNPPKCPKADFNLALLGASKNGRESVVKLLLTDRRANPATQGNIAIRYASAKGHTDVVKLLLADSRVDPSAEGNLAVLVASKNGHASVVKLLLADARIDLSDNGNNLALDWASKFGHASVVQLLLSDRRVDASSYGNSAVKGASLNGHTAVLELLLCDPKVNPSVNDNIAIKHASRNGYTEVVKLLMTDPRVDASVEDNNAVREASMNDHVGVVKLLLQDSRVVLSGGESTAFGISTQYQKLNVLRMLLGRASVVVTKEALLNADERNCGSVIDLFISEQPHVVSRLCADGEILWKCDGVLVKALNHWEARSAEFLLLCVKRTQTPVVAGRLNDVLREALEQFANFGVGFDVNEE